MAFMGQMTSPLAPKKNLVPYQNDAPAMPAAPTTPAAPPPSNTSSVYRPPVSGDRKTGYLSVANAAQDVRAGTAAMRPQYESNLGGIQAYQNYQQNENPSFPTIRQGWNSIISNPNRPVQNYQIGYSPETQQAMRTAGSDVVAGGRTRALQNINRQAAAQGMGSTGAAMRSAMSLEPTWTSKALDARRQADLDAAAQERSDYWKAQDANTGDYWKGQENLQYGLKGLDTAEQGRENFNLKSFDTERNALNDQAALFGYDIGSLNPETNALQGAYKPGFWGQLGSSFAGALGNTLGLGNVKISKSI